MHPLKISEPHPQKIEYSMKLDDFTNTTITPDTLYPDGWNPLTPNTAGVYPYIYDHSKIINTPRPLTQQEMDDLWNSLQGGLHNHQTSDIVDLEQILNSLRGPGWTSNLTLKALFDMIVGLQNKIEELQKQIDNKQLCPDPYEHMKMDI